MQIRVLEVNVDDYLHGGVYQLVCEWVRTFPENIKIDIAALEEFEDPAHVEELKKRNCNVYYVGTKENKIKKQIAIYKNVKRLIQEQKYDVVHLHSDVAHKILVSGMAAKKCGVKKIIFHSHANDVEGNHKGLRRIFHKLCAVMLKSIPAVHIATSQDAGKWMFPGAGDVIILNNGVDYENYRYDGAVRKQVREKLKIQDRFVIGFVGRFVDQKNPFYLLDIMEKVKTEIPGALLMCIGQGRLLDEFESMAVQKGLQDNVRLLGGADNVKDYYQAMDIMLMPSNFEGFGLVAVEAQASSTPIAASDKVPEMTRISSLISYLPIGTENTGIWVNEIKKYLHYEKEDRQDEMDHVYDLKNMVDELTAIYAG